MRYHINLIEEKPVFNVFPKGNDKKLIEISIRKLSDDIRRNINFHQCPNKQLNKLIDKYKVFANDNPEHLENLSELLSQLDDGEFTP